jgi:hypothetical protein
MSRNLPIDAPEIKLKVAKRSERGCPQPQQQQEDIRALAIL